MVTLRAEAAGLEAQLERLRREDALGQLLERRGRMAELATESGRAMLDWVDQLAWALDHPDALRGVEDLAASIRELGIRHLVWAGMGGSVQTVHTLTQLGLTGTDPVVHPLDSTDPAALNRLLRAIAPDGDVAAALRHTLMLGVSMGMTSEEPITHLTWFDGLLREHGVDPPGEHVMVMTLPDSYLDRFARERGARRVDLQPDGASGTPGRMSAPSTRVFLLPAALALGPGGLPTTVARIQDEYRLRRDLPAAEREALLAADPFVRLAAFFSAQIEQGRDMVLLDLPPEWQALAPWVEQVVEESLGKGGRGLLVFHGQDLAAAGSWPDRFSVLRVNGGSGVELDGRPLAVLDLGTGAGDVPARLAVAGRFFAGWDVAVALLGYLQGITFAGQPAVEGYKRHARTLRDRPGPLPYPTDDLAVAGDGRLALYYGAVPEVDGGVGEPAAVLADATERLLERGRLDYFDLTINADPAGPFWDAARELGIRFGNGVLGRPAKVRSGPRDYHSTEQSETDGPPNLLSLRVLVRRTEPVSAGSYEPRFLHAQALGTALAMREAGRPVLLALLESRDDVSLLEEMLQGAAVRLRAAPLDSPTST